VRIINLADELGLASMNSRHYRTLRTAIRIEASAYRKALDIDQAMAIHAARVQPTVRPGSPTRRSAPSAVRRPPSRQPLRPSALKHQAMAFSSWLFIRDPEGIWIERPYGYSIIVAGPGSARAHLVFTDEAALQGFQVATAERLAPLSLDERRSVLNPRRGGV
jgi:hypothetical protein